MKMPHELGSILIIIHPPLAILGYLFTFLAAWNMGKLLFRRKDRKRDNRDFGLSLAVAWWLTFLGLVTGMIWAQVAWGSFWSWDPKETAALAVFVTLTIVYVMNLRELPLKVHLLPLHRSSFILIRNDSSKRKHGNHKYNIIFHR